MEEAAGEERGQQAVLDEEVVEAGSEWQWGLLVLEWMMGQEVMDPESEEPEGSVPPLLHQCSSLTAHEKHFLSPPLKQKHHH